jgi:hypothetical protein
VNEMPEISKPRTPAIQTMLIPKSDYVRVDDWQGKSLTFILADDVLVKQKPALLDRRRNRTEKRGE